MIIDIICQILLCLPCHEICYILLAVKAWIILYFQNKQLQLLHLSRVWQRQKIKSRVWHLRWLFIHFSFFNHIIHNYVFSGVDINNVHCLASLMLTVCVLHEKCKFDWTLTCFHILWININNFFIRYWLYLKVWNIEHAFIISDLFWSINLTCRIMSDLKHYIFENITK